MNTPLPAGATLSDSPLGCQVLKLAAKGGTVTVALTGATVLSYIPDAGPSAGRDLLWLSPKATARDGKPIRGGVPVCGPWFGPHPSLQGAPIHGLLRIRTWTLSRVEALPDGGLHAELTIDLPPARELGWNHSAAASFDITVNSSLHLELSVRNTGSSPFVLSNALHTYFCTSDVRQVRVEGLADREYVDFTGGGVRRRYPNTPVTLTQESAWFFLSGSPVRLVDEAWGRAINLRPWGSAATPVWNPWEKTALGIADIGADWTGFVCVETANIPDTGVPLPPSMTQHLGVEITAAAI